LSSLGGDQVPTKVGIRVQFPHRRHRHSLPGRREPGHFVLGKEAPTPVDTGVATITNQRIVFQGPLQTREWDYAKLLGYQHFDSPPWTAIQVSNR
jgi:hypothetical protein